LLLGCLIVWAAGKRPSRDSAGLSVHSEITNRPVRVTITNSIDPYIEEVTAPFHWAELESPDYRIYIANLRMIGCPERTIRDIITADVSAFYSDRVRRMVDEVSPSFWNLMAHNEQFAALVNEKYEELEALAEEQEELMAVLINNDEANAAALAELKASNALADWKWKLDYLPEEKVASVHLAHWQFEKGREEVDRNEANLSSEEQRTRMQELTAERDRAIEAALTSDELAEYQVRTSGAADIRTRATTLDLTEAEARALAQARMMSRGAEEQVAAVLGPERYAIFQRDADGDYQQTLKIVERFDLPRETAVTLFEMRRQAANLASQVRQDSSRTTEERQAILAALQAETSQSIEAALGPAVFKTYTKYNGSWLSNFADNAE
jgi:hypothetical protein